MKKRRSIITTKHTKRLPGGGVARPAHQLFPGVRQPSPSNRASPSPSSERPPEGCDADHLKKFPELLKKDSGWPEPPKPKAAPLHLTTIRAPLFQVKGQAKNHRPDKNLAKDLPISPVIPVIAISFLLLKNGKALAMRTI